MVVEIPVREKYLHHQVKKVSSKNSGNTGSSKKNRHPGPGGVKSAAPARVRVMVLTGNGRRSWAWQ